VINTIVPDCACSKDRGKDKGGGEDDKIHPSQTCASPLLHQPKKIQTSDFILNH